MIVRGEFSVVVSKGCHRALVKCRIYSRDYRLVFSDDDVKKLTNGRLSNGILIIEPYTRRELSGHRLCFGFFRSGRPGALSRAVYLHTRYTNDNFYLSAYHR